jgi:GNAT superfamily N-acetyltransferase
MAIEHATAAELHFVEDAWVNSQRDYYAGTPSPAYYPWIRKLVREVMARSLVLVDREDGLVLAYIVAESAGSKRRAVRVHHLYTRRDWRREGRAFRLLARACELLGGEKLEYTCRVARSAKVEQRPWTVQKWCTALGARFVHEGEATRESA